MPVRRLLASKIMGEDRLLRNRPGCAIAQASPRSQHPPPASGDPDGDRVRPRTESNQLTLELPCESRTWAVRLVSKLLPDRGSRLVNAGSPLCEPALFNESPGQTRAACDCRQARPAFRDLPTHLVGPVGPDARHHGATVLLAVRPRPGPPNTTTVRGRSDGHCRYEPFGYLMRYSSCGCSRESQCS